MKVERIRNATVVSPDAAGAKQTFEDLFHLATAGPTALTIGESRIEFVTPASGTRLAEALATSGEGMAEICLRVADLPAAAETLTTAGVDFADETVDGQRVLHVASGAAHGVRLTLRDFD